MTKTKITCTPENAALIAEWIAKRGAVVLWNSHNLSDPGQTWTTPKVNEDGTPKGKPHWAAGEIIGEATSTDDVDVEVAEEVKRFHVAVRRGDSGLSFKCTDASSDRIRKAVAKAQENSAYKVAYHTFDYFTQEAVILAVTKIVSLTEFLKGASHVEGQGA